MLCGRGSSAFDDASVDGHGKPHHEAGHSPSVTLRTQHRVARTDVTALFLSTEISWVAVGRR